MQFRCVSYFIFFSYLSPFFSSVWPNCCLKIKCEFEHSSGLWLANFDIIARFKCNSNVRWNRSKRCMETMVNMELVCSIHCRCVWLDYGVCIIFIWSWPIENNKIRRRKKEHRPKWTRCVYTNRINDWKMAINDRTQHKRFSLRINGSDSGEFCWFFSFVFLYFYHILSHWFMELIVNVWFGTRGCANLTD